jgi:hypothetical protein
MLLEELYSQDPKNHVKVAEAAYLVTLQYWMVYNQLEIYERMLDHYEQKEEYAICEGINRAIEKIESTMDYHFQEAESLEEDEDQILYTHEEHQRVSRLIFEDILKEIYERQIKTTEEGDREADKAED